MDHIRSKKEDERDDGQPDKNFRVFLMSEFFFRKETCCDWKLNMYEFLPTKEKKNFRVDVHVGIEFRVPMQRMLLVVPEDFENDRLFFDVVHKCSANIHRDLEGKYFVIQLEVITTF